MTLGCGSSVAPFTGNWQARLANLGEVSPDTKTTLERVNIVIRSDRTFTMVQYGIRLDGDVSVSGGKITLTPKKIINRPIEETSGAMASLGKPKEGKLDGQTLVIELGAAGEVRFSKIGPETLIGKQ